MSTVDPGLQLEPGESNDPLHDEALRKALAQAPDRTALPDWRVRQAILDHAHGATSAAEELLAASRERTPWWSLAWWRHKAGVSGATPWNAALASLMLAVLVTLLWQREPVPGARPDDEPVTAPAPAPAAKEAQTARDEVATAKTEPAPAASVAPPQEAKPASPPATAEAPAREPAPARTEREVRGGVGGAARPLAESSAPAPAPRATTPAPPVADAPAERRKSVPSPATAPNAPPAAQPAPAPEANKQGSDLRQAAPAATPAARGEAMPMSDFSSLSRWTELRVANVNGSVRVVPRAEAGDLGLLMSSAAIMAVGGPPLRSLPEWRVSLERRGQVLAVLEVARSDVRWTEGGLPPATGRPPAEALDALRSALSQAIKPGAPAKAQPAPSAPAAPAAPPASRTPPAEAPRPTQ